MVAVAEIDSSGGRTAGARIRSADLQQPVGTRLGMLALLVALVWGVVVPKAMANPTGGVAVVGQATFVNNGNKLLVTTQNAAGQNFSAINWQSFSIPAGSSTYFAQPTAASTSINRVVTNTPSQIFGSLSSNGNLVLVNQAGIAVGTGAVVDTNGFTASSLAMSDADAMAGRLRFVDGQIGTSAVSVNGSILARNGDAVLIGSNVNTGVDALIQAPNGSTILAAGQRVEITGRGLEGIRLQVQAPADLAVNLGTLSGDAVGMFAGTLRHSGLIQATTATLEGGRVVLKSSGDAYVEGNGRIVATGVTGGSVDVLGQRVAIVDNASIDASGQNGGGSIRVGGDYQGSNAAVRNASMTYFGESATLRADALNEGSGGRVIVWADDAARVYGNISARGGAAGGDGGFVETSGKAYLDFQGHVDTRAADGAAGTLLLDPADITIQTGSDLQISPGTPFSGTGTLGPSVLSVATLLGALSSGDVVVDASGGSGGTGNVTVTDPVSWANSSKLTLQSSAGGSVAINAGITAANGSLTLDAGSIGVTQTAAVAVKTVDVTSSGTIAINGTLNGSSISLASTGGGISIGSAVAATGDLTLVQSYSMQSIALAGGSLSALGATSITAYNGFSIDSGGLNLSYANNQNLTLISTNGTVTLPASGISLGSGDLYIKGMSVTLFNDISTSGTVKLEATSGSISQYGSPYPMLHAGSLEAIASTYISLDSPSNQIGAVAANASGGSITLRNTSAMTVGQVGNTYGLQASASIAINSTRAITLNEQVSGAGVSITTTGAIAQGSSGSLDSSSGYGADITLSAASIGAAGGTYGYGNSVVVYPGSGKLIATATAGDVHAYDCCSIFNVGDVSAAGKVHLTGSYDMNIVGTVTASGTGNAVQLDVSNSSLTVSGYGNIVAPNGRWLVYANESGYGGGVNLGGLVPAFKQYGSYFGDTVLGSGNGILYNGVNPIAGGTMGGTVTKVYDGSTSISLSGATISGLSTNNGDDLTVATFAGGSGTLANPNVGTWSVNPDYLKFTGVSASENSNMTVYYLSPGIGNTASGSVTPATVTLNLAGSRVYDGTTSVLPGLYSLPTNVSFSGTGTSASKNVGTWGVSGFGLGGTNASNYTLGAVNITITPLAITGISGIVAGATREYDGTTKAPIDISGAKLIGVVATDIVALDLSKVEANFKDPFWGSKKPIDITGLAISGADIANYTFDTGLSKLSIVGDIKQRALSTWKGGATGDWSVASNWDALPVGDNVLAVNLGGANVSYDGLTTKLNSLTVAGGLIVGGGSLTIGSGLSLTQFSQKGGSLEVASLTATSGFNQSAGTLTSSGAVSGTQASGTLNVSGITAASVGLTATTGAITQSGPIVAPSLTTASATGTNLTGAGNKVATFTATNSGAGDIALANTGVLDISGMNNANGNITVNNIGGVTTRTIVGNGNVSFTANSPLTIGDGGITATGNVALTATNLTSSGNLTINGDVVSTGGGIALAAASDFVQNSTVNAAGGVTATAGGTMSFGPSAKSIGSPLSYSDAKGPIPAPGQVPQGSAPIDFVSTFMSKFEGALLAQNGPSDDPAEEKKKDKDVVVEGQSCTR
jgi:filamentous hemagglutinin family protein